ncbi:MAG: hypothetical protein ACR2P4_07105 [Gammaproteobacteria bacterium]
MTEMKNYNNSTIEVCFAPGLDINSLAVACTVKIETKEQGQHIRVEYDFGGSTTAYEGAKDAGGVFRLDGVQGEKGQATLCRLNDSVLVGDWITQEPAGMRGLWKINLDE